MNAVHSFIKELVSNEQFRRLALANPSAAFSRYQLTAAEQQSLTRLCGRLSAQGTVASEVRPNAYWV